MNNRVTRNTSFPWPVFLEECPTYRRLLNNVLKSYVNEMPLAVRRRFLLSNRTDHQRTSFAMCETCWIKFFPGDGLGAGDRSNGHHDSRTRRTSISSPKVIWSHLVTTPTHVPLTKLTENTRAAITDTTPYMLGQDWPTSPHKQTA